MNMQSPPAELLRKARLAGVLYLVIVVLGFYGIMYVPSQVHVVGDPQATFDNLLAREFLFRTGIYAHLLNTVVFTLMVLVFYQLFVEVNRFLAMAMVALVIVHISFEFGSELLNLAGLMVAKGQLLVSLDLVQRQEWSYFFLRMSKHGSMGLSIAFWGLWLIPLGVLVFKSGFIPRIFGVLLILGGMAYIIESVFFILFPGQGGILKSLLFLVYAVAEIAFMLWLVIKGARTHPTGRAANIRQ